MSVKRASLLVLLATFLPLPSSAGLSDGGNSGLRTKEAVRPDGYPPFPDFGGRLSNRPVAVEYFWHHFKPGNPDFRPSLAGGTNNALIGSITGLESAIDVNDSIAPGLKPLDQEKKSGLAAQRVQTGCSR